MLYACCTAETFTPFELTGCQWLQRDSDFKIAEWYWQQLNSPLKHETWITAYKYGYQYAVILDQGKPICCAGVWRYSGKSWDVCAVSTLPQYRQRGYSKRIVSFITTYILESGHIATVRTSETNIAMITTAKKVGFQEIPREKIWWQYPELPAF